MPSSQKPDVHAVILAAGLGTRMKSTMPKAAHCIAGQPMLARVLAAAAQVASSMTVVIGPDMDALAKIAAPSPVVIQIERLGTAHAALCAADNFGDGEVIIIFADNPLITAEKLHELITTRRVSGAGLALMTFKPTDPGHYGRVIIGAKNGSVNIERIVEWADATPTERLADLCNGGVMCGPAVRVLAWLRAVDCDNAKKEYYLTDIVGLAVKDGLSVIPVSVGEKEIGGVNTRAELAAAEWVIQQQLRTTAMDSGVTLMAPETVYLSYDTRIGADTVVSPNVVFGPGVTIGDGCDIGPFTSLTGCIIPPGTVIRAFPRMHPVAEGLI